jgi:DNA repair protein RadD
MTMQLRDYQRAAVDSVYQHFSERDDNALVVMPTGSGKSPTLCTFIKGAIDSWPDTRIVVLSHVAELVEQSYKTLLRIWPEAPATICSAGLGQKNLKGQIVFASIQSIYKHAYKLQRVDLIIVDEAQLIPPSGDGMYRKFLNELQQINPQVKAVGFTATPWRTSSGLLTDGDNPFFGSICYDIGIGDLIEQGYLCPPVSKAMTTRFDTSGVATRGGEFVPGALAEAVDRDALTAAAVEEIVAYGQDRRAWLAFGCSVEHAHHIRDAIRLHGYTAETVTGETPKAERAELVRAYRAGEIRCLSNVDVLTVGFDAPHTDLLAVLRPTKSAGLWCQIIGRGTRLSPDTGKSNCLVLDFSENTARFGPIDKIKPKSKSKGAGEAPIKECPNCQSIIFAGLRVCPDCGNEFIFLGAVIQSTAATDALLSTQSAPPPPPEWLNVANVGYSLHTKPGKPTSMKVRYRCGMTWHSAWWCFNHTGYARMTAERLWQQSGGGLPMPATTEEALERTDELVQPTRILVRKDGDFTRVDRMDFTPVAPEHQNTETPQRQNTTDFDAQWAELEGLEF